MAYITSYRLQQIAAHSERWERGAATDHEMELAAGAMVAAYREITELTFDHLVEHYLSDQEDESTDASETDYD